MLGRPSATNWRTLFIPSSRGPRTYYFYFRHPVGGALWSAIHGAYKAYRATGCEGAGILSLKSNTPSYYFKAARPESSALAALTLQGEKALNTCSALFAFEHCAHAALLMPVSSHTMTRLQIQAQHISVTVATRQHTMVQITDLCTKDFPHSRISMIKLEKALL